MKRLLIPLLLLLFADSAWAKPPELSAATENALLERYGVAVMIRASGNQSVPPEHPIYQLILGKLQREMRRAEFLVFNAMLPLAEPAGTPEEGFKQSLVQLDNPYLDTVLMVDARLSLPKAVDSSSRETQFEVELIVQFIDVATGQSFAALHESSLLRLAEACDKACMSQNIKRAAISLTGQISGDVVHAIQADHRQGEYSLADAGS